MSRKRFECVDCGIDTGKSNEYYMLRDEVWALTGLGPRGMLCIGCVETKIGRKLHKSDFNDSFVNTFPMPRSMRLVDRLKGT
jgi:hypothetical protein